MCMRMKASPGVPTIVAFAVLSLLSYPAVAQHGGHGVGYGGGHSVGHISGGHFTGHAGRHRVGHVSVGHSARHSVGHFSVGHSAGHSVSHLGGHGTLHLSVGHIGASHVIHHSGQHLFHIGLYDSSLHHGYSPYRRSYPSYQRIRYESSNPAVLVLGTTIPEAPRSDNAPHSDDEPRSSSDGIPMSIPLVEALESPEVLPPLDDEGEDDPHSADDHSQETHDHEEPH